MAIKGLSLSDTRDYQSELDDARGTPEATTFKIGTLDSRVFGMIRDKATSISVDPNNPNGDVQTSINMNEVNFATVQYGLKGWSNFRDDRGNDIAFKTIKRSHGGASYDVVDPDLLKQVPSVVISELAEQIRADNEVPVAEAKN
jgi:hypothetical protein